MEFEIEKSASIFCQESLKEKKKTTNTWEYKKQIVLSKWRRQKK